MLGEDFEEEDEDESEDLSEEETNDEEALKYGQNHWDILRKEEEWKESKVIVQFKSKSCLSSLFRIPQINPFFFLICWSISQEKALQQLFRLSPHPLNPLTACQRSLMPTLVIVMRKLTQKTMICSTNSIQMIWTRMSLMFLVLNALYP